MFLTIRWLAYWLSAGLLCWCTLVVASTPEPEYLTVRNGLPQGFINSIIQDRKGFVWLATRDGLCRYDGTRFRIFTHVPQDDHSLSFSSIYGIQEDRGGKLWIRTENNHIDRFDPVTEQSNRISNSPAFTQALDRDQLVGIQPDRAGNVWVATRTNGFFRLNANGTIAHRQWAAQANSARTIIQNVLLDKKGQLWLATENGLFRYDPATEKLVPFISSDGLLQGKVYRLHERRNGELMLGYPGRFAIINPTNGRVRQVVGLPNTPGLPVFTRDQQEIGRAHV